MHRAEEEAKPTAPPLPSSPAWDGRAEAQGPAKEQLRGPQSILASKPSLGAKGQS